MITFEIQTYAPDADRLLVKCPPEGNQLVGRMFPGTLDTEAGGFAIPANRLGHLVQAVEKAGDRFVDGRHTPTGVWHREHHLPRWEGRRPALDADQQREVNAAGMARVRLMANLYRALLERYAETGDADEARADLLELQCHCAQPDHLGARHSPRHGPVEIDARDRLGRPWPRLPRCAEPECFCPEYGP